jgi:hypothetical protein
MSDEADRAAPGVDEERQRIADELRRVRETVRDRALHERTAGAGLPPAAPVRTPGPMPPDPEPPPLALPPRPDNAPLNESWRIAPVPGGGWRDRLGRWLAGLLHPYWESQEAFNSRQVRFDNETLAYIDARLAETHRHYDAVLGIHGRHMGEIDERHLILQEELVAHVHDLVRRIDLVLAEAEKGRLSLEFALRYVRARLARLEERLGKG